MSECTITERRNMVDCYVIEADGTVWIVYEACQHGIAEVTPIYTPRIDLNAEPQTTDQVAAVGEGL